MKSLESLSCLRRVEMDKLEVYKDGNKIYISTKFLATYTKTNPRNVSHWIKKGLEVHKVENIKSNLFILEDAIEWIEKNINKTKSNNRKGIESDDGGLDNALSDYESLSTVEKRAFLRSLDKNSLDEQNTVEQILEREAKNKAHDKNWVRKEKPSETVRALTRSFISILRNMMITISKDGENKSQDELYHIIDKYLYTEISKFRRLLQSEGSDVNLDEIYQLIVDIYNNGTDIPTIVNKLGELVK